MKTAGLMTIDDASQTMAGWLTAFSRVRGQISRAAYPQAASIMRKPQLDRWM